MALLEIPKPLLLSLNKPRIYFVNIDPRRNINGVEPPPAQTASLVSAPKAFNRRPPCEKLVVGRTRLKLDTVSGMPAALFHFVK